MFLERSVLKREQLWPDNISGTVNKLNIRFLRMNSWINPKRLGVGMCLLLVWPALALDPTKSVYQYSCRSWARQNGLSANGVNAVIQSKDGYLWLGTAMGLVRFDGIEFKL